MARVDYEQIVSMLIEFRTERDEALRQRSELAHALDDMTNKWGQAEAREYKADSRAAAFRSQAERLSRQLAEANRMATQMTAEHTETVKDLTTTIAGLREDCAALEAELEKHGLLPPQIEDDEDKDKDEGDPL